MLRSKAVKGLSGNEAGRSLCGKHRVIVYRNMWVLTQNKIISRLSYWNGANRNLSGNGREISLCGRWMGRAVLIRSPPRPRRIFPTAEFPTDPLHQSTTPQPLPQRRTDSRPCPWSKAAGGLFGSVRKKPRYSVWKILVGRIVPHPCGS